MNRIKVGTKMYKVLMDGTEVDCCEVVKVWESNNNIIDVNIAVKTGFPLQLHMHIDFNAFINNETFFFPNNECYLFKDESVANDYASKLYLEFLKTKMEEHMKIAENCSYKHKFLTYLTSKPLTCLVGTVANTSKEETNSSFVSMTGFTTYDVVLKDCKMSYGRHLAHLTYDKMRSAIYINHLPIKIDGLIFGVNNILVTCNGRTFCIPFDALSISKKTDSEIEKLLF